MSNKITIKKFKKNTDKRIKLTKPITSKNNSAMLNKIDVTNCLALTIQKDHKLVAIKNVAFRSFRMSFKVMISSIALGLFRLFS